MSPELGQEMGQEMGEKSAQKVVNIGPETVQKRRT